MNGFQEGSIFNPFFIPLKKFLEEKKYDTPMPPQKVFKNYLSSPLNSGSHQAMPILLLQDDPVVL